MNKYINAMMIGLTDQEDIRIIKLYVSNKILYMHII